MVVYVAYALRHPEMSFWGGNKVAYLVYTAYIIITVLMFILSRLTIKK